jgi:hypothetical protein
MPPFVHEDKNPGDLIRSKDWNLLGNEVLRLGADKISRAGEESLDGPLTVRGALSVGAGSAGGGLTVKGDLSVGTPTAGAAVRVLRRQEDGKDAAHGALVLGTDSTSSGALRLGYYSTYSWLQGQGQQNIAINPHGGNVGIGTAAAPAARLHVEGDLRVTGALGFGNVTRQMVNLWGSGYGIGVQNSTTYLRSDGNFAFYRGGSHNDAQLNAGGGTALAVLGSDGTLTAGAFRFGNNSLLSANQGGSIELGGDSNTAGTGTPYIDFHYSGLQQDYNTRIINDANDRLSIMAGVVQLGCYDFKMGHTSRRGTPGRALVDNTNVLALNYAGDWAGGVSVGGRLRTPSGRAVVTATNKQDLRPGGWTDMPNMSVSITTTGNQVLLMFKSGGVQITGAAKAAGQFRMLVDGNQVAFALHEFYNGGWELRDVTLMWMGDLSAATHTVTVQWLVGAGVLSCSWYNDPRSIIAIEL